MGNSGNTHQIHAAVHNHQAEQQSTVVESTGKVNNVKLKILFYPGATDNFISAYALNNYGVVAYDNDDFEQVEMASGVKQVVRLKVRGCQVKLGVCTTKLDAYVTNLAIYDLIVGMDWLEGHRAFMDCYAKKVLCLDDEGRAIQIQGRKSKISLRFISAVKAKRCLRQGCQLFVVEMVSDSKGHSLNSYPVLSDFKDVFPKELLGLPPE